MRETLASLSRRARSDYGVNRLLTESAKTLKSEKRSVLTGILYLSAARKFLGGSTCPAATKACAAACLGHHSGRMVMSTVQRAQAARTTMLAAMYNDADHYGWRMLRLEVAALAARAARKGMVAAVRINGTSDLGFHGLAPLAAIRGDFPAVRFYDYTKRSEFLSAWWADSVDLTYSASERDDVAAVADLLGRGVRVAMVFRHKGSFAGRTWNGIALVDGDAHDARFLDPRGAIVALTAKGKRMRNDASGFVRTLD